MIPDAGKLSRPPLVLIADDQEWSARSIETILGPRGYAVLRAYNGKQALELARTGQPDAVILALRLPEPNGTEVCAALSSDPRFSSVIPIIITTAGAPSREQRHAAYEAGAWELYGQPFDGELMLLKLDTYMRAKRETDELRDENLLDAATGLYNMQGLSLRAREIGAQAFRRHEPLACVAISAQPAPGASAQDSQRDDVLIAAEHVALTCRRSGRVSDAIGRLGKAEFAIIAPATEASGAVRLVERLRECVEAHPVPLGGEPRKVSIKAGYYAVPDFATSPVDAVEMLLRAVKALQSLREEGNGTRLRRFEDLSLSSA